MERWYQRAMECIHDGGLLLDAETWWLCYNTKHNLAEEIFKANDKGSIDWNA
jgi:hypothetical protein